MWLTEENFIPKTVTAVVISKVNWVQHFADNNK